MAAGYDIAGLILAGLILSQPRWLCLSFWGDDVVLTIRGISFNSKNRASYLTIIVGHKRTCDVRTFQLQNATLSEI